MKRKQKKNTKPYNSRLLRYFLCEKHYLDSADVIKLKLLYIFHICGKEWYISIYIWIYLFTDTLQLPFKTLQKLKLSSPISKVYWKKPRQCCVVKCLVLLRIHVLLGHPLLSRTSGGTGEFSAILLYDVKMQEAAWHGGFQGLYSWLRGSLWNCVKMLFSFLMFCQMLLKCFYILNILLYFPKKININRTAW